MKPVRLGLFLLGCAGWFGHGSAQTVNSYSGQLSTSTGSAIPAGSAVLLVVATGTGGLQSVQTGSSLTVGSFINGNDQIIAAGGSFTGGAFSISTGEMNIGTGTFSGVQAGQTVELLWFSNVTNGGTATGGSMYGTYTSTVDGQDWTIPSGGNTVDLTFETSDFGGNNTIQQSEANQTVGGMSAVPEPPTWGLIAGVAALAYAVAARRRPVEATASSL